MIFSKDFRVWRFFLDQSNSIYAKCCKKTKFSVSCFDTPGLNEADNVAADSLLGEWASSRSGLIS